MISTSYWPHICDTLSIVFVHFGHMSYLVYVLFSVCPIWCLVCVFAFHCYGSWASLHQLYVQVYPDNIVHSSPPPPLCLANVCASAVVLWRAFMFVLQVPWQWRLLVWRSSRFLWCHICCVSCPESCIHVWKLSRFPEGKTCLCSLESVACRKGRGGGDSVKTVYSKATIGVGEIQSSCFILVIGTGHPLMYGSDIWSPRFPGNDTCISVTSVWQWLCSL